MRVLVTLKKVEILNMPSDGSTTWGLETLKNSGGSMLRRREPIGPTANPIIPRTKITRAMGIKSLVEHPIFIT